MGKRIRKAVFPVAGLGVRLLPATKTQPKEMLPIVDRPAVQYVVEEAIASGIENLLFVTGRGKRAIEDYFDFAVELEYELKSRGKEHLLEEVRSVANSAQIFYVRQKSPRGLGDAVFQARAFVGDEPFAVLLPDDIIVSDPPCLAQMLRLFSACPGVYVALIEVPRNEVSQWGIVKGQEVAPRLYRIEDLVEKPEPHEAPSNLAVVGRYLLPPSIFEALAETRPGKGGEIQLTDALRKLLGKEPMYGYCFEGEYFGVGSKLGYLKANVAFALRRQDLACEFRAFLRDLVERGLV
ncbi:UTP--glucose-1-phosphate uridylyltransferase GalU [Candidatus Caldatribacterium sp.]|uniref:UTP--glucose-1-phosphate uridylyltransferase GalU n=1 Tax=Candidatus Caldatribacterium sp. TaxID=2282143 RepID=UPI00299CC039|nr:UTP--glucose-1-phosphate uridylyltransferase GalU [Candidatus Caldatribacterium sp.]MDW8081334.1 UTP--glucose-1-phosphate uridylyltransferase GalU [Candidatus Calescibacterium sp.]